MSVAKKGPVFMIHGWAQNAKVMQIKTKNMTRKLQKAGYDCIFLDAPHQLPDKGGIASVERQQRENARAWFLYSETDPTDASQSQSGHPVTYFGIQQSLDLICHELAQHEFVAGVFGFSQGAVLAHVLAQLQASSPPFDRIQTCILASGFRAQHIIFDPKHASDFDCDQRDDQHQAMIRRLPSLHMIGRKDTSVRPQLSLELAKQFERHEILYHDKGHMVAQQSAHCARVIQFLDENSRTMVR